MTTKKQVIVIGAGIAGTSAAAALSDICDVTVLEQESHPGYHSTGRSAATWAPFYGPEVIQALTAQSLSLLATPDAAFSERPFTSPKGELMLGRTGDDAEIERHLAMGMQRISLQDAQAMVPLVKAQNIESILYTDNMLDIDVDALHQAFIKYFKQSNGHLICNAPVTAISRQDNRWQVITKANHYACDIIVNASGAWADHIAQLAGVQTLGIQPKRRTAALVPYIEGANMPKWPMVFGAGENFYCTPFGNALMVSPADATPVEPHDAWPDDLDVARGIDEFQKYIDYDIERVEHQWAGLRTFTPDGEPAVGFATDAPGFFWLAGQGGYGIQTAAALAASCRYLIGGPQTPDGLFGAPDQATLQRLDPQRFH